MRRMTDNTQFDYVKYLIIVITRFLNSRKRPVKNEIAVNTTTEISERQVISLERKTPIIVNLSNIELLSIFHQHIIY